jgi:hypothetical protein
MGTIFNPCKANSDSRLHLHTLTSGNRIPSSEVALPLGGVVFPQAMLRKEKNYRILK